MKLEHVGTYSVGDYFANYEANGDSTGLSDNEQFAFDDWAYELLAGYGNHYEAPLIFDWSGDCDSFGTCEVTGLRGATIAVQVYAYQKEG
jgi:hypothetical protein